MTASTHPGTRVCHSGIAVLCVLFVLLGFAPASCLAVERVAAVALFKGKAMLSIDGKQRLVKVGETTPEGVALLKASAEAVVISFDGEQRELTLDSRIAGNFGQAPARQIIRLVPGRHGHYFVDGQINRQSVRFLVDTGASSVAINKNLAKRLGIRYEVVGERGSVQTASGQADAYRVLFSEVKVQALRIPNVRGIVIDGDSPSEALLGQSFLNRLDMRREGAVLELRER